MSHHRISSHSLASSETEDVSQTYDGAFTIIFIIEQCLVDVMTQWCLPSNGFQIHKLKSGGFASIVSLMAFSQEESSAIVCCDYVCLLVGTGTALEPRNTNRAIFLYHWCKQVRILERAGMTEGSQKAEEYEGSNVIKI